MNKIKLTQVKEEKIHSIHKFGIELRDIKSENILFTKDKQIRFINLRTVSDMNDQTFEGSGSGRKSNQNKQLSNNLILNILWELHNLWLLNALEIKILIKNQIFIYQECYVRILITQCLHKQLKQNLNFPSLNEIMKNQLLSENFDWKTQQGKIVGSNKIFRKYQMIQAKLIDILIIWVRIKQCRKLVEQGQFQI